MRRAKGVGDVGACGRVARIVLTKRGRPVAVLVPVREQPVEGVDLTEPVEEAWAAEHD